MSVTVDIEGRIAVITVNRPEALNALNTEVLNGIRDAVLDLPPTVHGILLTGAGKAFVAGADIAEMADYTPAEAEAFSLNGQLAFQALVDYHGPVIAAINGFALGGGLELALACDILVASDRAKLGLPETTLAVVPGFGGTQRLPRRIGPGRAKKLLFTGEIISAQDAFHMGLVDDVIGADELMDHARSMLEKMLRNGPIAVRQCKGLVDEGLEMAIEDGLTMEAAAFGAIFDTEDQKIGMRAFLAKEKPTFKGA